MFHTDSCTTTLHTHLNSTKGVEEVCVVVGGRAEPTRGLLAFFDKGEYLLLVHPLQVVHEVHGGEAPVHTTHAQELCDTVLLQAMRVDICSCARARVYVYLCASLHVYMC